MSHIIASLFDHVFRTTAGFSIALIHLLELLNSLCVDVEPGYLLYFGAARLGPKFDGFEA